MALYDENGAHLVAAIRVPKYVSANTKEHRDFLYSVAKIGKKVRRGSTSENVEGASYSVGFIYDRFWKRNNSSMIHEVEWNIKNSDWVKR